jgi:hypothetical protein
MCEKMNLRVIDDLLFGAASDIDDGSARGT